MLINKRITLSDRIFFVSLTRIESMTGKRVFYLTPDFITATGKMAEDYYGIPIRILWERESTYWRPENALLMYEETLEPQIQLILDSILTEEFLVLYFASENHIKSMRELLRRRYDIGSHAITPHDQDTTRDGTPYLFGVSHGTPQISKISSPVVREKISSN